MSQVIDFMNTNIRFMSRFPGAPSHGNFSGRGVELHFDAVISMEESGEGEYDFVVLRLEIFVNQNGNLQSSAKLIFDSPANETSSDYWIPFVETKSFEQTILSYLNSCGITDNLEGEGMALARGIDLLRQHFSDVITFTTHAKKTCRIRGKTNGLRDHSDKEEKCVLAQLTEQCRQTAEAIDPEEVVALWEKTCVEGRALSEKVERNGWEAVMDEIEPLLAAQS